MTFEWVTVHIRLKSSTLFTYIVEVPPLQFLAVKYIGLPLFKLIVQKHD